MKLRIRDNSIRLRLTQTEVEAVVNDGRVAGTVMFSVDSYFDYVLQCSDEILVPQAALSGNVLTVSAPEFMIVNWANSNDVSISDTQEVDGDVDLHILIEKDFACLAPREGEDESDMYPHPEAGNANC